VRGGGVEGGSQASQAIGGEPPGRPRPGLAASLLRGA
jgi:hypothetical protein